MSNSDSAAAAQEQRDLRGVLPAGSRLRSYEVIGALGQGNFGITYRAYDPTLGRDVAIKEYLPTALALRGPGMTVLPRSADLVDMFTWGRERQGHLWATEGALTVPRDWPSARSRGP